VSLRTLALLFLTAGCGVKSGGIVVGSGDTGGGDDEGVSDPSAAVLVPIDATTVFLGEWDALIINRFGGDGSEHQTVIPETEFALSAYWIDRYPFPGIPDEPWFFDGLDHPTVEALDVWLADYGRRACTVAELLYAAAGPDNHRYPYGDGTFDASACDPDDTAPAAIGTYTDCNSALGVRDFQVRSTWGRLDARTEAVMADTAQASNFPGESVYASWGGTSRSDTFYAPSNFGFHIHDVADDPYLDDGFRVCAGPNPPTDEENAAYAYWLEDAIAAGSYDGLFE